jgi:DNA repair exonuclease SbcCD ATPase subunit
LKSCRPRWADQQPELQARVSQVREEVGSALFAVDQGEENEEVRDDPVLAEIAEALTEVLVRASGAEQRMATVLEALDHASAHAESVREELEQRVSGIQQGVADAILGAEPRAALAGQLDTFMETQRQEIARVQLRAEEWLAGARDRLEQARSVLEQERKVHAELEQRLAHTHQELEAVMADRQKLEERTQALKQDTRRYAPSAILLGQADRGLPAHILLIVLGIPANLLLVGALFSADARNGSRLRKFFGCQSRQSTLMSSIG